MVWTRSRQGPAAARGPVARQQIARAPLLAASRHPSAAREASTAPARAPASAMAGGGRSCTA
eukprot:3067424-Prymnesium_polylepis.2